MTSRQLAGYHLIRLAVASVFLVHALARIGLGIVDDFAGYWMATFGVSRSVGLVASWTVTGVELIGGLAIALDRWVLPFAIWFGAQMVVGILTIHGKAGWFVVGAGRNGMEYSVLILAGLATVVLLQPKRR
jgi:putative oxidoreductase